MNDSYDIFKYSRIRLSVEGISLTPETRRLETRFRHSFAVTNALSSIFGFAQVWFRQRSKPSGNARS